MSAIWSGWQELPSKKNKLSQFLSINLLTSRQREVAAKIAEGKSCKQIARELGIHFLTVMKHRENLYRRLGVSSAIALTIRLKGGDR